MSHKTPEARSAYHRAYRLRNKSKIKRDQAAYRVANRKKLVAYTAAWRKKNPDRMPALRRRYWLKRNYNLTVEGWNILFAAQGYRCAACKTYDPGRYWHTDHDHKTGRVRGILCAACNTAIGHAKDDLDRLMACAEYLRERNICPVPAIKIDQFGGISAANSLS